MVYLEGHGDVVSRLVMDKKMEIAIVFGVQGQGAK